MPTISLAVTRGHAFVTRQHNTFYTHINVCYSNILYNICTADFEMSTCSPDQMELKHARTSGGFLRL